MNEGQRSQVLWRGRETLDEILSLIAPSASIEIQMAPEYHHALFRAIYPAAPAGAPEEIDAEGGPELLAKIAAINGLEDMKDMISPLAKAKAGVRIAGRATVTITVP